MNNEKIVPLILCGGKGSRLWPLSRQSYSKQFLHIGKCNNKTLLQNTLERISNLENQSKVSQRVDINVLKSRLREKENIILKKNILILISCLTLIIAAGISVTYL